MPFCGFNAKMVTGLGIFAKGLFEATSERAKKEGLSMEMAFDREVEDLGAMLEALEARYQYLKKEGLKTGEVMKGVADWLHEKDVKE